MAPADPDGAPRPRLVRTLAVAAALSALLTLGAGLRFVYTFAEMREAGEYVHSVDPDPYYHLRRLEYSARNRGAPLVADGFAAAPAIFRCPWPVAFDYLALGFHRALFGRDDSRESLGLSAGFLPILLGLALVGLVFVVLLPRGGIGAALAGAAFVAATRESLSVSAFGMFDHHALEAIACLAIPAAFAVAQRQGVGLAALLGGLGFGLGLLCADAAYLVVVAAGAVLALHALRPGDERERRAGLGFAVGALGGGALASALEIAAGLERALPHAGRVGLLLGLVGLALAGWRSRGALAGASVCLLVGIALAGSMLRGAGYLVASDPISATILQARPLWVVGPEWVPRALVALVAAAIIAGIRRRQRGDHLLSAMALLGGALGLAQAKYSFLIAWTGAWGFGLGVGAIHARLDGRPRRAFAFVAALGGLLWLGARTRTEVRESPPGLRAVDRAFVELLPSLRALPAQPVLAPGGRPAYTIVAPPGEGPRLLYLAGQAVTAVPFWSSDASRSQYEATDAIYAARDEAALNAQLGRLRARYLLVVRAAELDPASVAARLSRGQRLAGFRRVGDGGDGLYQLFEVVP